MFSRTAPFCVQDVEGIASSQDAPVFYLTSCDFTKPETLRQQSHFLIKKTEGMCHSCDWTEQRYDWLEGKVTESHRYPWYVATALGLMHKWKVKNWLKSNCPNHNTIKIPPDFLSLSVHMYITSIALHSWPLFPGNVDINSIITSVGGEYQYLSALNLNDPQSDGMRQTQNHTPSALVSNHRALRCIHRCSRNPGINLYKSPGTFPSKSTILNMSETLRLPP